MVLSVVWHDHFQPWNRAVPCSEALRVLSSGACGSPVRAAEHDWSVDLASGHVQRLCSGVDDLVDGLHRKVPCHELENRAHATLCSADCHAGEAMLHHRRHVELRCSLRQAD